MTDSLKLSDVFSLHPFIMSPPPPLEMDEELVRLVYLPNGALIPVEIKSTSKYVDREYDRQ